MFPWTNGSGDFLTPGGLLLRGKEWWSFTEMVKQLGGRGTFLQKSEVKTLLEE